MQSLSIGRHVLYTDLYLQNLHFFVVKICDAIKILMVLFKAFFSELSMPLCLFGTRFL